MVMVTTEAGELEFSELELDDFEGRQRTQAVLLEDVSWQTYKALLNDMGNHRTVRVAYNQGTLTLKMPSKLHEIVNRLLARIVDILTEEFGLEVVNVGSLTLERADLQRGAEPDTGFYIQNADQLEGLNPEIPETLPPDLVIEIDITSPSTQRMAIYQTLGVAEVWQYTQREGVVIFHLKTEGYVSADASQVFPLLGADKLNEFLVQRQTQGANQVIRSVREWARSLLTKQSQ